MQDRGLNPEPLGQPRGRVWRVVLPNQGVPYVCGQLALPGLLRCWSLNAFIILLYFSKPLLEYPKSNPLRIYNGSEKWI